MEQFRLLLAKVDNSLIKSRQIGTLTSDNEVLCYSLLF